MSAAQQMGGGHGADGLEVYVRCENAPAVNFYHNARCDAQAAGFLQQETDQGVACPQQPTRFHVQPVAQ